MHGTRLPAVLALAIACGGAAAAAHQVVLPHAAPNPVRFGADRIRAAFDARDEDVRVVEPDDGEPGDGLRVEIVIQTGSRDPEESYRILRPNQRTVRVAAGDPVGAMYGCFDVAEQIEFSDEPVSFDRVRPRARTPFLRLRADNPFITLGEDNTISPWFYDEAYWTAYIRQLALNRYNVLDLHAMYQIVQTGFPNAYPYFIGLDAFPESAAPGEDIERNLRILNRIIEIAADHGVRVALMNYSAHFPGTFRPKLENAVLERVDSAIDFDWQDQGPGDPVGNDEFSARWTGELLAPVSGTYTLRVESDDGVRLWIDDELVADEWSEHAVETCEARVDLAADRPAPFRAEYFEARGDAVVRVSWIRPGRDEPEIIPPSAFRHRGPEGPYAPGLAAVYFSEDTSRDLVRITRACVSAMIDRCPGLWMLGFRVGESGQPEDFYRRAYLPAFAGAGRPIRLYTRTWLAKQDDLARIADGFPGLFAVEIKYNGEHLGAPYHAIQDYGHSYSYQNYLDLPRGWEIVWQIRCNGTHRLFRWTDPEFMRATVRSCRLGDAWGFTMEPVTAYYSQDPADYYRHPSEVPFAWMFEKHWAWYLCWGRLAYDPDTPDEVFRLRFRERFGAGTGNAAYATLLSMSRIVPAIYRAHAPSADHRGMAPEFENGNNNRDVLRFAETRPLDRHTHLSPLDYARMRLAGRVSGCITPVEAAGDLERASDETLAHARGLESLAADNGEVRDLVHDARCLAHLGAYHAEKLRGAVDVAFLVETGDLTRAVSARRHLERAREAWARLAATAEDRYRPLLDTLRMHTQEFTWTAEGAKLERQDLGWLDARVAGILAAPGVVGGHVPPARAAPGASIEIVAGVRAPEGTTMHADWRIDANAPWDRLAFDRTGDHAWSGSIPLPEGADGRTLHYRIVAAKPDVPETILGPGKEYRVPVTSDDIPPRIPWVRARPMRRNGFLRIRAEVEDNARVREVLLLHKVLPTGEGRRWVATPMHLEGAGLRRQGSAEIPLTPHGLLYAVEAVDEAGNVTRWPDPRNDSPPYRVVDPFPPPPDPGA